MKKIENKIGFRSSMYDTRVTVHGKAKDSKECDNAIPALVLSENRYFNAILQAFNDYIDEQVKGIQFTEGVMTRKIEAAQLLFKKDWFELSKLYKSGACSIIKA